MLPSSGGRELRLTERRVTADEIPLMKRDFNVTSR